MAGGDTTNEDMEKVANVSESLDPEDLINEKNEIERCANSGECYYYSDALSGSAVAELKEYAAVCGISDKFVSVSNSDQRSSKSLLELRASQSEESAPRDKSAPLEGPFEVDSTPEEAFQKNRDWEDVSIAKRFEELEIEASASPGILPNHSVRNLRGGESNDVSREVGVRAGENSMVAPNAIGESVDSEEVGSRELILAENEQRKEDISFRVSDWEAEVLASMKEKNILPDEGIHRVESNQSQMHTPNVGTGQFSIADSFSERSDTAPEKTAGERIAESNDVRKESIQRSKEDGSDWNDVHSSSHSKISDSFFDSLKASLGK
jgi:hypothetical protein